MSYTIPVFLLITFVVALIKRVNLFETFTAGIADALKLVVNIIPYLAAIFIAVELMRASGISAWLGKGISPAFSLLGIPKELSELLILRPLSGSGSLVLLEDIFVTYGVDSYPARVASVLMGSTDTVFYIAAVYFSAAKEKKSGLAIPIAMTASFIGTVLAVWLCKIM